MKIININTIGVETPDVIAKVYELVDQNGSSAWSLHWLDSNRACLMMHDTQGEDEVI